jgi:carboxyl-terminal processing protease
MKDKNYSYKSAVEHELQQFTEEARKERYYPELKAQLDLMNTKIAESKKNELLLYKDQIKMLIEEEIVARHHLERGGIEARFKYDNDVRKAVDVLHNDALYKKTLSRP